MTVDPVDPGDIRTFTLDYSTLLADLVSGSISDSAWDVPSGLTIVAQTKTSKTTSIKLSFESASVGRNYTLYNTVELAGGDSRRRALTIPVRDSAFFDAGPSSAPSQAERIVAEIDNLIERSTGGDTYEYEVDGNRKRTYTRTELLEVRKTYQRKVNSERRRKRVAAGGDFFQTIPVTLTTVR